MNLFFDATPITSNPLTNRLGVLLRSYRFGLLAREPKRPQQPWQIVNVIVHTKLTANHLCDPRTCPQVRVIAGRLSTLDENLPELVPLTGSKLVGPSRHRLGPNRLDPATPRGSQPAIDALACGIEPCGDSRRLPFLFMESKGFQPPILQRLGTSMGSHITIIGYTIRGTLL